ncbi:unnamed protein product [Rhizophagus irregularis]|uniref:Uncharacterized protein n=1 Tax=Rhizophagus irregularis TaxID=588596 RepID=A0A2N1M541_9GLOM|nr:hypothetical protein RhiirC2_799308 [Rhizophagus irregularis]CAB4382398.1 unnamed protein product [Rhizophagus irregularis]CAB5361933.1 unnamed protein product [Rhizophagus irregularis]
MSGKGSNIPLKDGKVQKEGSKLTKQFKNLVKESASNAKGNLSLCDLEKTAESKRLTSPKKPKQQKQTELTDFYKTPGGDTVMKK